jgi:hypothetical protein
MALENNIAIGAPGSIVTPPAGEVTRFFNTDYTPARLYYKDENGDVFVWPETAEDADCCACEIAKNLAEKMACSLASGMITATEYQAMITLGAQVSAVENTDVDGNKTCTVSISPSFVAATALSTNPSVINPLAVGSQNVIIPTVLPVNATFKQVVWTSSNPTIATVDSNGVVTGVAAGTCTITCTHVLGVLTDTTTVTVV